MLTTFEMDEYVVAALRAGASGFLGKGAGRPSCSTASGVAAGRRCSSPKATRALIARSSPARPAPAADARPFAALTPASARSSTSSRTG